MKLPSNFGDFLKNSTYFSSKNNIPNNKMNILTTTTSAIALATIRSQIDKQSKPSEEAKIFTAFWLSISQ